MNWSLWLFYFFPTSLIESIVFFLSKVILVSNGPAVAGVCNDTHSPCLEPWWVVLAAPFSGSGIASWSFASVEEAAGEMFWPLRGQLSPSTLPHPHPSLSPQPPHPHLHAAFGKECPSPHHIFWAAFYSWPCSTGHLYRMVLQVRERCPPFSAPCHLRQLRADPVWEAGKTDMRVEELKPPLVRNSIREGGPCISPGQNRRAGSGDVSVGDLDLRTWEQENRLSSLL